MTDVRFVRKGVSLFDFLPAVADTVAGPTTTEISAGTSLTPDLAGISGFSLANTPAATPDFASSFSGSIPGEDTAPASSLTFYERSTSAVFETALPKGTVGFVYIRRKGTGTAKAKSADLHPIIVSEKSPAYSSGNDPAQFTVSVTITSRPTLDLAPPA